MRFKHVEEGPNDYQYDLLWIEHYEEKEKETVRAEIKKDDYTGVNRDNLRIIASQKKIPGRGRMTKEQLLASLRAQVKPIPAPVVPKEDDFTYVGVELRKRKEERDRGNLPHSVSVFALVHKNTKKAPEYNVNAPCHASVRSVSGLLAFVDDIECFRKRHTFKEQYDRYIDYMLNRSPYASGFLTKKLSDAIVSGVFYDTNKSNSVCVASAIGLREGSEYPNRMEIFGDVLALGFSERTAHIAAQWLNKTKDGKYKTTYPSGAHMSTISSMESEEYFRFFREGYFKDPGTPAKEAAHGYKIFETIAEIAYYNYKNNIGKVIPPFFKQENLKCWDRESIITLRNLYAGLEKIEEKLNERPAQAISTTNP